MNLSASNTGKQNILAFISNQAFKDRQWKIDHSFPQYCNHFNLHKSWFINVTQTYILTTKHAPYLIFWGKKSNNSSHVEPYSYWILSRQDSNLNYGFLLVSSFVMKKDSNNFFRQFRQEKNDNHFDKTCCFSFSLYKCML